VKIAPAAFTFDIALRNLMRQSTRRSDERALRSALLPRFTVKRLLKGGSLRRKLDKSGRSAQSDASWSSDGGGDRR